MSINLNINQSCPIKWGIYIGYLPLMQIALLSMVDILLYSVEEYDKSI
jgi:hypothetical protein